MTRTKKEINEFFIKVISEEMHIDPEEIDVDAAFFTHGLDSISSIYVLDKLEDFAEVKISPLDFWDYPTIEKFSTYLVEKQQKE